MFDGSSSVDPDGEIVSYSWDFGDGSRSSNRRVRHTFNQPGTFTVRLVVTDTDGATAVDSAQVIAAAPGIVNPDDPTDPDQAPTTDDSDGPDTSNDELDPEEVTRLDLGGPYELEAGESLSLASPTEIGDSSPVGFAWDFGDGSTATTPEITHTWEFPGRFTISLTVELADGSTAFADSIVTVRAPDLGDGAPIPDIGGPYTVVAGRSLTLDGSASRDPDGEVVKWEWNVGADELLEGETVQHTFGAAGTYPIVLRVTDDDGNSELTTASVEVFPVECALTEDQVRDFRARPRVATTQNALTTLRLVVAVDCAGLQVAFAVDGRVVDPRVSIGPAGLAESTFRMPGDLDPGVHPITTLVGDDGDVLVESTWELSLGDGTPCDLTANQIKETTARPSGNGVRVTIDLVRVPNCDVQPVMVEISGGPTEVTPRSLDVDSKTTSITMSASGGVAPGDYEVRVSAGDETISETGVTLRSPDAERGFSFWWIAGAMAITATILAVFAVPFFFRNVTIPGL